MEFLAHFTLYGTNALHPTILSILRCSSTPFQNSLEQRCLHMVTGTVSRTAVSKSVVCNFLKMTRLQILLISN